MSRLHKEIESLEGKIVKMAELASSMLVEGVSSLTQLDRALSEAVIGRRDLLAQLDEEIEMHILRTFALEEPVAGDLRRIATGLKLITYINRIGRYGYDIARVTRDWPAKQEHVARMVNLPVMGEKVAAMLASAIESFKANTVPDSKFVQGLEDDVNALRYSVWRECLTFMAADPQTIERCAHYMMVARYLERCGDNVCKIVEKQHWGATGERFLFP